MWGIFSWLGPIYSFFLRPLGGVNGLEWLEFSWVADPSFSNRFNLLLNIELQGWLNVLLAENFNSHIDWNFTYKGLIGNENLYQRGFKGGRSNEVLNTLLQFLNSLIYKPLMNKSRGLKVGQMT